MKYPILLHRNNDQNNYLVSVPDLPGCQTKADNIDMAIEKISESITAHLTILAEYGEKIPHGKNIESHHNESIDGIWAIVDIDISPYLGKSHKINVTLPELLIKQIDDRVSKSQAYKTRSGFIAAACMVELIKP
jgi:predicted RNase H-like HicB family nuclease